MNPWIGASIAIAAGVVVGLVASRLVRRSLSGATQPALRESATALSGLALSIAVIIGLLVALGFVADDELEQLKEDTIAFLPKAISALIILIGANVASRFAAAAVSTSLAGTGGAARFAPAITRFAILGGGAIVAAGQTEVDTDVIHIAVAALLFGVSIAFALLTGFGGRAVASEVAAGRAVRRFLQVGDRVELASGGVSGVVADLHPTAVGLVVDGRTILVPNRRFLEGEVVHERPEAADAAGELRR